MASVINDFNKIQINKTIDKNPDGEVTRRSLMINIRADSVEEADKLYKDLKQVFNGNMTAKNEDNEKNDKNPVCPKCGNSLIIRKGKNGEFLGCSSYPKCRFTKEIDGNEPEVVDVGSVPF